MTESICNLCEKPSSKTKCHSCVIKIRRIRQKQAAVSRLGGKCRRCGWTGNHAALDFHHPGTKNFQLSDLMEASWDTLRTEIDRCELLCVICHRLEALRFSDPERAIRKLEDFRSRPETVFIEEWKNKVATASSGSEPEISPAIVQLLVKNSLSYRQIGLIFNLTRRQIELYIKRTNSQAEKLATGTGPSKRSPNRRVPTACKLCDGVNKSRYLTCKACRTFIKRWKSRKRAVESLGSKCTRCDWTGNFYGFDFHHVGDKDIEIHKLFGKSWARIETELQKCELLCARCHRVEHSKRDDPRLLAAVAAYNGRELN